MNLLITGGGCEEPVDGVRFLTNFSTGNTAAVLIEEFVRRGASVTALLGRRAAAPQVPPRKCIRFSGFDDLYGLLEDFLSGEAYDAVVMAAAVSDYRVDRIEAGGTTFRGGKAAKLDSSGDIVLHLKRNEKIITRLKGWSLKQPLIVVGFKLTNKAGEEEREAAAMSLMRKGEVDAVVSNDLTEISDSVHRARLYGAGGELGSVEDKASLSGLIWNYLQGASS
jgi:phosphopantothenoylcysteine synthetase/decarboxylase